MPPVTSDPMEITVAPPNSIIFVNDPTSEADIPQDIGRGLVWATDTCVAIGTLAEMDGETTIRLARDFPTPRGEVIYEGTIKTPGRLVAINTSEGVPLISLTTGPESRLTVWANDSSEPDLILVRAL